MLIIAQVCLRLATIKGHSKMCNFPVLGEGSGFDCVFQVLPISSNFAQPLKRSGPTFSIDKPPKM